MKPGRFSPRDAATFAILASAFTSTWKISKTRPSSDLLPTNRKWSFAYAMRGARQYYWRMESATGPKERLRAHFLAQAAKCQRSAARVQRGPLTLSYLDQAKKWELMAQRLDADEIPQREARQD